MKCTKFMLRILVSTFLCVGPYQLFILLKFIKNKQRSHLIKEILTNCSFSESADIDHILGSCEQVSVFNISLKLCFNNVFLIYFKFVPYLIEVLHYNVTLKINDLI